MLKRKRSPSVQRSSSLIRKKRKVESPRKRKQVVSPFISRKKRRVSTPKMNIELAFSSTEQKTPRKKKFSTKISPDIIEGPTGQYLEIKNFYSPTERLPLLLDALNRDMKKVPLWFKPFKKYDPKDLSDYKVLFYFGTKFLTSKYKKFYCCPEVRVELKKNDVEIEIDETKENLLNEYNKNDSMAFIIFITKGKSGHLTVCYLDKKSNMIEFYDSNGKQGHLDLYGNQVITELPKFFKAIFGIPEDRFIMFGDKIRGSGEKVYDVFTWSFQSFQAFSEKYSEIQDAGLCMMWGLYTLSLRLKNRKLSSENFQLNLNNYFSLLYSKAVKKFGKNDSEINAYMYDKFAEFIYDFILYLEKNIQNYRL